MFTKRLKLDFLPENIFHFITSSFSIMFNAYIVHIFKNQMTDDELFLFWVKENSNNASFFFKNAGSILPVISFHLFFVPKSGNFSNFKTTQAIRHRRAIILKLLLLFCASYHLSSFNSTKHTIPINHSKPHYHHHHHHMQIYDLLPVYYYI